MGARMGRPRRSFGTLSEVSVYEIDRRAGLGGKPRRGYQASVRVRRHDGSEAQIRRTRSSRTEAREAVLEAAEKARTQTAAGAPVGAAVSLTDRSTVAELAAAYVEWLEGERSPATVTQYRGTVARYIEPHLSAVAVADTTPDILEVIETRYGMSAWRSARAVLGGAWKWALKRRYITAENQVLGTRSAARPRPKVSTVTPTELRAVIERAKLYRDARDVPGPGGPRVPWLVNLLPVSLATGARVSELVSMRWEDIDGLDADDGSPVTVTIQGVKVRHQRAAGNDPQRRPRALTLAPFAVEALRQQREDLGDAITLSPWVWPTGSAAGTHLQKDAVHRALRRVYDYQPQKGAPLPQLRGIPVTPHVLRHTVATWVAHDAPGGEQTAARLLGHLGQSVTATYYVADETADVANVVQSRWEE